MTPDTSSISEAEFRLVMRELSDLKFALDQHAMVTITDQRGIIQYANDRFCEISGYEREELIGQDHRLISSGHHPHSFIRNLWVTIAHGRVWRGEICNRAKNGLLYWVDTTIVPFLNTEGKPYQYIAIRTDISTRKQAELELHTLSRRLVDVQEQERRHLARELHDEIGQYLTGLKLTLEAVTRLPQEAAASRLLFAQNIAETLLSRVRDLSVELRPVALDNLGLIPALGLLFSRYTSQTRVKVRFEHEALRERYQPDIETGIYRIIQEALTNVARHAKTQDVSVHLWEVGGYLLLYITDTGCGFDSSKSINTSNGLTGMRERILALGGELLITSKQDYGTQISASIPIPVYKEG